MMQRKFHDVGHADAYLNGSIIRYRNYPIVVKSIKSQNRKWVLFFYYVHSQKNGKATMYEDERLDMSPMELGLIPVEEEDTCKTGFLSRYPQRRWKQGLTPQSILLQTCYGSEGIRNMDPRTCKGLTTCVRNEYLFFDEAFTKARQIGRERPCVIPFSRNWAVTGNGKLVYKGWEVAVGECNPYPVLYDLAEFLKEDLEGAVV